MEPVISLKNRQSDLPVLVVSMHEESVYAELVLRAGANGYVMKQEPAKTVKAAIRKVLAGDIHLSEKMRASLLGKFMRNEQSESSSSPVAKLSNRELEVFRMLGQGKATRLIAKELGLESAAINTFHHRIMKKLELKNALDLVVQANRWAREEAMGVNRWP